jgi:GDPmannose 4,6-dehydratase
MKKALICGISGQDGAYLAKLLLEKGYIVIGTSRDAQLSSFSNLQKLGIYEKITFETMALNDYRSVLNVVMNTLPDEIYNLAGQTSVALSFQQPVETIESIIIGTLNLLEAIRFAKKEIKFYNAGSSECFGNTSKDGANEESVFKPMSPYGVAKSASFWQVDSYRNAYNLFCVTGILFNHESTLRDKRFVSKKIINTACRIKNGSSEKLELGNLYIRRDWGWAPEYVEAMWKMLQNKTPVDYVIGTGINHSLEDFVIQTFSLLDLDWRSHVVENKMFNRPSDISISIANPTKANRDLNWKATTELKDLIKIMITEEITQYENI